MLEFSIIFNVFRHENVFNCKGRWPAAFIYREKSREIIEIMDRWYDGGIDPDQLIVDYFKVKADEEVFNLRYAAETGAWPGFSYQDSINI